MTNLRIQIETAYLVEILQKYETDDMSGLSLTSSDDDQSILVGVRDCRKKKSTRTKPPSLRQYHHFARREVLQLHLTFI